MKKLVIAGVLVASTFVLTGTAQAEPLPGGQPPCSIIYHSPAQSAGGPLCTHPVPGT